MGVSRRIGSSGSTLVIMIMMDGYGHELRFQEMGVRTKKQVKGTRNPLHDINQYALMGPGQALASKIPGSHHHSRHITWKKV